MAPKTIAGILLLFTLALHAEDRTPVAAKPIQTIYVSGFDVDVAEDRPDETFLSDDQIRLEARGGRENAQRRANELIFLMSKSLVEELGNEDLPAERLLPGARKPKKGWLLTGVFAEAEEGNRLRRAVIGFGTGKTELQVYATVTDLSKKKQPLLYKISAAAEKSKMPGALITLNEYVATAKLGVNRRVIAKDVEKAAEKLAQQIATKLKPQEGK